MTSITYCPDCGAINDISGSGSAGSQLHDTPRKGAVEAAIEEAEVERVDESGCAFLTMLSYDGELTEYNLAATGAPMMATDSDNNPIPCDHCGTEPVKRLLLLVEIIDEEQRLLALKCDECGFDPERASDWIFDIRETETATVHEWYCPECGDEDGYPVWQDYVDVDERIVSEWDDRYDESGDDG